MLTVCFSTNKSQHDIRDQPLVALDLPRGSKIAPEDVSERMSIGDLEPSQRGNRHVQIDSVHVGPKNPFPCASDEHVADDVDNRRVESVHPIRLANVASTGLILRDHQRHEIRMLLVIVKRECDQAAHRLQGRRMAEVQCFFSSWPPR